VATAGRPRRLYDVEAAVLATAAVLAGRAGPGRVAAARVHMAGDARSVATARGSTLAVPEYELARQGGGLGEIGSTAVVAKLSGVPPAGCNR
jgi:hypothetical protein